MAVDARVVTEVGRTITTSNISISISHLYKLFLNYQYLDLVDLKKIIFTLVDDTLAHDYLVVEFIVQIISENRTLPFC